VKDKATGNAYYNIWAQLDNNHMQTGYFSVYATAVVTSVNKVSITQVKFSQGSVATV